jgi:ParB-like chromosome segregation protein Spo0J
MTETSNQTQRPHSKTSRDYAGASQRKVEFLATNSLIPDAANPRKHSRAQIRDIAKSVKAFGFANPVLIDRDRKILAGHGRLEAAKLLGLTEIPVIFLDHLTEAQAKAFSLAENRLHDRSTFDDFKVAIQLKDLSALDLDFDIEATGFESPEIEFRIGSLDTSDTSDVADEFDSPMGPPLCVPKTLFELMP